MMKRVLIGVATAATLSCGTVAAEDLNIGLWDNPDTIDPTTGRLYSGRLILNMICDKLFDITPDLQIVPVLATGYEISDDGLQMTIGIRDGVKFHDGEPLNADAVKYTLERHINTTGSMRRSEVNVIDTIDVIDPMTVRLNLKQPSAPLLSYFTDRSGMIVSPKAAEALGEKFGNQPVCSGPFKMTNRAAQDQIVLEKFEDYWNAENIHIDRVVLTPIPDGTVRVANLRAGQLDMIERVSPQDLGVLREDPNIETTSIPELGYQVLTFNVGNGDKADNPMGTDIRLREAFDAAIDRSVITKVVFQDEYLPGSQYVSPTNFFFNPDYPVPPRDIEKAKRLVKEAGYDRVPVTLTTANNPDWLQAVQIIQSMVGEAGFDLTIDSQENATRSKRMKSGDFQAGFSFWSGRADPDGNITNRAGCGSPNNDAGYCNEVVDENIKMGRETADRAERQKYYYAITEQLAEDKALLFIWHRLVITAFNNKVEGFTQYPDGLFRLTGVTIDSSS